jgi:RNA polymerase sigma factor (sigma-70 family)
MERLRIVRPNPEVAGEPPGDELSRLALTARARGDLLAELVRRLELHPQLRSLSIRLGRELAWHGPDDLMQLTLERVVRGLASYRGSGDFAGWVSRIMRNAHIEWLRKEASEGAKLGDYAREVSHEDPSDPIRRLHEEDLRRTVLQIWDARRRDPDVRVFWDRAFVGLSVEQIMRSTGHPRSTVYAMLKKGALKFVRDWKSLHARGQ